MVAILKTRPQDVIISHHAWSERWPERAGVKMKKGRLLHMVKSALTNKAKGQGIRLDSTGAGRVEVMPGLYAVVRLTDHGWVVTTVLEG